ncbi:MAG: Hsp20/alpha crystallin family protein [Steroidobacteraceae bacterium]
MNLTPYEPWQLLTRLQRDFDRSFAWLPTVDVSEDDTRYLVRADLPGVEQKDIEITTDKGVLTLRGVRQFENRGEARFLRHFSLPENAVLDEIRARHVNGVLEVSIPKQPKVAPKRITVEAA